MTINPSLHEARRLLPWIGDNALNAVAYLSLQVTSPLRAAHWVRTAASLGVPIVTIEEAHRVSRRLSGRGTCLSRSLVVAARCARAEVVIGVIPPGAARVRDSGTSSTIEAHAWVEMGGVPLMVGTEWPWVEVGRVSIGSPGPKD